MDTPDDILKRAARRAAEKNLPYAGAVTPAEAHALVLAGGRLIDIRTNAELEWVGFVPDAAHVEWNTWPEGKRNPNFAEQLEAAVPDKDDPVLFLCRSGGRSNAAAAVAATLGYTKALNVLEGFEGERNEDGHRGTVGGWKKAGLPWHQH